MIYHGGGGHDLNGLDLAVASCVEVLEDELERFDCIVVTGMSGVVVGSPVALAVNKPLVIVRKADDDSHHGGGQIINGRALKGARVLFLDDFVSGGATRKRVEAKIDTERYRAKIVGELMYRPFTSPYDESEPLTWRA